MKPDVSVIMYVKNGMPYFERALHSVLNQTLHNIEVLVIDGGSTDKTVECTKQYQSRDSRIRFLHSSKGSVGAQFNLGVKEAKGEYIGIVESDDFILPEMYEKELACAREYDCDMLRADNEIFFGDGDHEIRMRTRVSHNKSNYNRVMCASQEPENVLIGGSYWTGLYRREFLLEKNIQMHESAGAAYQDFSFLFLTSALADRVFIMPKAFYCYRKDNPASSCNRPTRLDLPIQEYRFLEEELKQRKIWEQYKEYFLLWKVRNERWFYANLDKTGKRDYVQLLYEDLKEMGSRSFSCELFHDKERELLAAVEQGEESLCAYLERKDQIWKESSKKIESLKADEIYLFGAGNLGRILCWFLRNRNDNVRKQNKAKIAYVDNAQELLGTDIEGTVVVSLQEALQSKKAFFLVCSENYADEIYCQLRDAGVDNRYIAVCDDMDACIRFVMRGYRNI